MIFEIRTEKPLFPLEAKVPEKWRPQNEPPMDEWQEYQQRLRKRDAELDAEMATLKRKRKRFRIVVLIALGLGCVTSAAMIAANLAVHSGWWALNHAVWLGVNGYLFVDIWRDK